MESNTDNNADNSDVVTMLDVLNEEKEFSDQACAVLAGSDEKNCNGFMKRQALYSCLTCAPDEAKQDFSKSVGICLGCSLNCHDKHDLVELYTKRNFHCDCGVKAGSACQLNSNKSAEGANNNHYNQNYAGLYCNCHRPYPDPENPSTDEMIQCVVCEDWYHSLHLNTKVPPSDAYAEMICGGCMMKNQFLGDYTGLAVVAVESEAKGDESSINVSSLNDSAGTSNDQDEDGQVKKKMRLSDDACIRPKSDDPGKTMTTSFWKEGWRSQLCKCTECMKLYKQLSVEYLTDLEDTSLFYEEKGKGKEVPSNYMASLEALSTLPRVNQIDAISSYNTFKEKLFEYLQTFVVNNQIVQEEDIQRFFRNMKDNSNDQAPVHQPHFCR